MKISKELVLTVGLSISGLSVLSAETPKTENNPTKVSQVDNPIDLTKKPGSKNTPLPPAESGGAIVVKNAADVFAPGGCGFRKALGGLVKVYEICFFGKGMKGSEWESAFDNPTAAKSFKLKLNFLRGVGGKNVSAAFSDGLSKTPAAQKLEELERQKFLAWAAKLKIEKASVMEFTFQEQKELRVNFYEKADDGAQPQVYESRQNGLAKAVAAIWLGKKPISEDLKKDLLK